MDIMFGSVLFGCVWMCLDGLCFGQIGYGFFGLLSYAGFCWDKLRFVMLC